jgi:hypothetical protein
MRLPPVTVAGETVDGLRAVVMDMARYRRSEGPPYAGILGADFLRHFDVELDVPGGRMRLWRHREGSAPPAAPRAPATLANVAPAEGFVAFDVAVGAIVARAILDSGAPTSTLNWHAAAAAGVSRESRESPGLAAIRSAAGVSGDFVETHSHRIDGIAVEDSASRRCR